MKKDTINLGYIHISSYKKNSDLVEIYEDTDEEFKLEQIKEKEQCDPNEIILQGGNQFDLEIIYPLETPFVTKLDTKNGLSRREVVDFVVKSYKQIYKEEKQSSKIKAANLPNMYNRNQTNGKYGIWGHDIGDLVLHSLYIDGNKLTVGVDS